MRLTAGGAESKITGFDLQNRRINVRCSGTLKNVDAFFFANAPVKCTWCLPDWHLNQMKTQFGQSSNVSKRFFQMLRVTVQKMPFVLTGHSGIFSSCFELFSCHDAVSSWISPDQFNMFTGFQ